MSELRFFHNYVSDIFQFDEPIFKSATDKKRGEAEAVPEGGWEF